MAIKNDNLETAVRSFWSWFAANAERLKTLQSSGDFAILAQEVNRKLDDIEPMLAWEIGPGKKAQNLLAISAEGNPELRPIADTIIQLAPNLPEWEFYSSRPARPAPPIIRLRNSDKSFSTSRWKFVPIERSESGRLDLAIVDDELATSDREPALMAVTIYLDQVLGEDMVEMWIGELKLLRTAEAQGKTMYEIAELSDYLLWATHRESGPLRTPERDAE